MNSEALYYQKLEAQQQKACQEYNLTISNLLQIINKCVETLEFCLNKEVFPQGVCKEDAETGAYTKVVQTLKYIGENLNK